MNKIQQKHATKDDYYIDCWNNILDNQKMLEITHNEMNINEIHQKMLN